jgi:hypothetical protein
MKCVWKQVEKQGYYRCKNCKLPAATTKLFLDKLPPSRNCPNPQAQFLLGDFLANALSGLSDDFKLRWGKRLDSVLGMKTEKAVSCGCHLRQKMLNAWTLTLAALPFYKRSWVISRDVARLFARAGRLALSRVSKV